MIVFSKLRWKNLLSYGNVFTEIDFQKNRMTLFSGKNGSGKSCILDALVFALFGLPYRNMNKPNLVNSINQKDCIAEVEFSVGKKKYLVRRGIKPIVFEIYTDGVLVNQQTTVKEYQRYLEQNILKLNYKSFTQLVVVGSANFKPFMSLPALERREVIEELLDIRVFSRMNIVLKEKMALLKDQKKDLERDILVVKEKRDMQKEHIDKINTQNTKLLKTNRTEIESNENTIHSINAEIQSIQGIADQKIVTIADMGSVTDKMAKLKDIRRKLAEQFSALNKDIGFYQENSNCPVCHQQIEVAFKESVVSEKQTRISDITNGLGELDSKYSELETRLAEIGKIQQEVNDLFARIQEKKTSISGIVAYNKRLEEEFSRLNATSQTDIKDDEKELENFRKEYEEMTAEKDSMLDLTMVYDTCYDLLKDKGIKTKIISQYLPIMNKLINKYLTNMDFFVNFTLDENFKEVIRSRYRDDFEYNSFSQGEKFRIDMALLLTWREISRKKNSTNTNILILDEVFDSSLDGSGTEEFMKLLKNLSKKINIFVISHKPDVISDKFDLHMKAEKKNNFSSLK